MVFNFVDVLITSTCNRANNFKWEKVKKKGKMEKKEGKEEQKGMVNLKSTVCDLLQPVSLCDYCLVAYLSCPRIEMSIQTQFSE